MSTADPPTTDPTAPPPRRRRRQRRRSGGAEWRQLAADSGVLALLLLASSALSLSTGLLTPPDGWAWSDDLLWPGLALLALSLTIGTTRLLRRLNGVQRWWFRTGCPRCRGNKLARVRRRPPDRLLGRIGLPVRRYQCRDCQWEGLRIDESRLN